MQETNDLVKNRLAALEEIKKMGINPYPHRFDVTANSAEILSTFKDPADEAEAEAQKQKIISVAGRIMAIRKMGKASFFQVKDDTGKIQIYIRQNDVGEELYKLFKLLDIGDIVGVNGFVFRTKMGEVSVHATTFELLTKTVQPLPVVKEETTETGEKIAKYGINVEDINEVIETALGGKTAGVIFEGDRKFDIVIKYDDEYKKNINAVKNVLVSSSTGLKLPLSELADIEIKDGYSEISRDDGKRRILVQCNVRGKDIETFIDELKAGISRDVELPPGYIVEYGGQFKNLESARNRLLLAVPVSLFFIFALLFAAFNSIKQGLLVFSGIPFAIVGGIFSLLVRGMPFSISAGVGFIALFGVAVLNGIVMIAYFNKLEEDGITNVHDRILKGTIARLRPILTTAMVASFGFIPMAISQGAGAEVQRPLATVVIGGLISSTLLTLIVLPVLYGIFNKHVNPKYDFKKTT